MNILRRGVLALFVPAGTSSIPLPTMFVLTAWLFKQVGGADGNREVWGKLNICGRRQSATFTSMSQVVLGTSRKGDPLLNPTYGSLKPYCEALYPQQGSP